MSNTGDIFLIIVLIVLIGPETFALFLLRLSVRVIASEIFCLHLIEITRIGLLLLIVDDTT